MDPTAVLGHRFEGTSFQYTERDASLYALAVGACGAVSRSPTGDPSKEQAQTQDGSAELEYSAPLILCTSFRVLPTFAVLFPASIVDQIISLKGLRFDPALLLHGEHLLELYKPALPTEAKVTSSTCVAGLQDKGKSAVLEVETESRDAATGEPLALNCASCVLRGAGGFGGENSRSLHRSLWRRNPPLTLQGAAKGAPSRAPDHILAQKIPHTQALLYRLCGDYNPLHADPTFAAEAGFPKPILHGLCTVGFACRALLLCVNKGQSPAADEDELALRRLRCRFLSHVFPGETLVTKIWVAGEESPLQGGLRALLTSYISRDSKERAVLSAVAELCPVSMHEAWIIGGSNSSRL